jgi:large subunit ribosomal protein L18
MKAKTRKEGIIRRHKRVRKKVFGTLERPRLAVYKSLKHIYAQIINDYEGHTLASASSLEKEIKDKSKKEKSILVGKLIAERAIKQNIDKVVFDRGGFKYHGRIKLLAEAAREAGLKF